MTGDDWRRALNRRLNNEFELIEQDNEVMHYRVAAVEEVIAARWPRRWLLAARLRRQLRASTRNIAAGGPFADRRAESASLDVHPGPRGGGAR